MKRLTYPTGRWAYVYVLFVEERDVLVMELNNYSLRESAAALGNGLKTLDKSWPLSAARTQLIFWRQTRFYRVFFLKHSAKTLLSAKRTLGTKEVRTRRDNSLATVTAPLPSALSVALSKSLRLCRVSQEGTRQSPKVLPSVPERHLKKLWGFAEYHGKSTR